MFYLHISSPVYCYNNRSHATFKSVAAFGRGSGDIVLDNVICTSDESSIAVCRHNGFEQINCEHDENVGVIYCECKISLN